MSILSLFTFSSASSASTIGGLLGYACESSKNQPIKVNIEIALMANHSVDKVTTYVDLHGASMKKGNRGYVTKVRDTQQIPLFVKIPVGQRKVTKTIVLNPAIQNKAVGCVHRANLNRVQHLDTAYKGANGFYHETAFSGKEMITIDNTKARTIDTCTIKLKQQSRTGTIFKVLRANCTSKKARR